MCCTYNLLTRNCRGVSGSTQNMENKMVGQQGEDKIIHLNWNLQKVVLSSFSCGQVGGLRKQNYLFLHHKAEIMATSKNTITYTSQHNRKESVS